MSRAADKPANAENPEALGSPWGCRVALSNLPAPGSLVAVRWFDAHAASTGWCTPDEIDTELYIVVSVGHVVEHHKEFHCVIAQSLILGSELHDGYLAIPFVNIVRIDDLTALAKDAVS